MMFSGASYKICCCDLDIEGTCAPFWSHLLAQIILSFGAFLRFKTRRFRRWCFEEIS